MNNPMDANSFKSIILNRYCGHYPPAASLADANVMKTSEDIMMDLRPVVDMTINEISEYMVEKEYVLDIDGGQPVWLMKENGMRSLEEHTD